MGQRRLLPHPHGAAHQPGAAAAAGDDVPAQQRAARHPGHPVDELHREPPAPDAVAPVRQAGAAQLPDRRARRRAVGRQQRPVDGAAVRDRRLEPGLPRRWRRRLGDDPPRLGAVPGAGGPHARRPHAVALGHGPARERWRHRVDGSREPQGRAAAPHPRQLLRRRFRRQPLRVERRSHPVHHQADHDLPDAQEAGQGRAPAGDRLRLRQAVGVAAPAVRELRAQVPPVRSAGLHLARLQRRRQRARRPGGVERARLGQEVVPRRAAPGLLRRPAHLEGRLDPAVAPRRSHRGVRHLRWPAVPVRRHRLEGVDRRYLVAHPLRQAHERGRGVLDRRHHVRRGAVPVAQHQEGSGDQRRRRAVRVARSEVRRGARGRSCGG